MAIDHMTSMLSDINPALEGLHKQNGRYISNAMPEHTVTRTARMPPPRAPGGKCSVQAAPGASKVTQSEVIHSAARLLSGDAVSRWGAVPVLNRALQR